MWPEVWAPLHIHLSSKIMLLANLKTETPWVHLPSELESQPLPSVTCVHLASGSCLLGWMEYHFWIGEVKERLCGEAGDKEGLGSFLRRGGRLDSEGGRRDVQRRRKVECQQGIQEHFNLIPSKPIYGPWIQLMYTCESVLFAATSLLLAKGLSN